MGVLTLNAAIGRGIAVQQVHQLVQVEVRCQQIPPPEIENRAKPRLAVLPINLAIHPTALESDQCLQQRRACDAIDVARLEDAPDISKQPHPWVLVEPIGTQGHRGSPRCFTISKTACSTPRRSRLVHPWCVLVADLDRLSTLDVADHPSWFKDNPRGGLCRPGRAALRYLSAADEQENVIVLILVNLANRCFVTHALTCNP
jgi:hypothetical protein